MQTRYAITATALANTASASTESVIDQVFSGISRLVPPSPHFAPPFKIVVGEMLNLPPAAEIASQYDTRLLRIAMLGIRQIEKQVRAAVSKYGGKRVAFVFGTCTGGLDRTEAAYKKLRVGEPAKGYDFETMHPLHVVPSQIARYLGVEGVVTVISTACSSSAKAVGVATRLLRAGVADAVLVGGADSLSLTTLYGFYSLGALSSQTTRPFSVERDGISLGEGCGFILIDGHAQAPTVVVGVGESSDAHHLSAPDPNGKGASIAMRSALAEAGMSASEVDYINAHGTGTVHNDASEGHAMVGVFGEKTAISSTKAVTGHMLGAGGITEVIFASEAIKLGVVPPNVTSGPIDPIVAGRIVCEARRMPVRIAMSNSFGFGGTNASVVVAAS